MREHLIAQLLDICETLIAQDQFQATFNPTRFIEIVGALKGTQANA